MCFGDRRRGETSQLLAKHVLVTHVRTSKASTSTVSMTCSVRCMPARSSGGSPSSMISSISISPSVLQKGYGPFRMPWFCRFCRFSDEFRLLTHEPLEASRNSWCWCANSCSTEHVSIRQHTSAYVSRYGGPVVHKHHAHITRAHTHTHTPLTSSDWCAEYLAQANPVGGAPLESVPRICNICFFI